MKVHTVQGNFRGNQIIIAAELANVKLELNFMPWSDLKSEQNLARNPLGQVPYLQTPEGFIYQTQACLRYIARVSNKLYGENLIEQAKVDQWLDFIVNNFGPAICPILFKILGFKGEQSDEIIKASKEATANLAAILDEELKIRTFLVGNQVTIADVSLFCWLVYGYRCVLDEQFRKKFNNLTRWFENMSNNPIIQKYVGKNRYVKQPWF